MKKRRILILALPVVAIILELLPSGVTMDWGHQLPDGTIGRIQTYCSHFDILPAAYGYFAPFFTAILTCLLLVLCLITVFTGKGKRAVKVLAVLAFVVSAISVGMAVFLLDYFPGIGIAITVALGLNILLSFFLLAEHPLSVEEQNG